MKKKEEEKKKGLNHPESRRQYIVGNGSRMEKNPEKIAR